MFLSRYHRIISFFSYLVGFMLFVLSLVKTRYRLQFFMVSNSIFKHWFEISF